MRIREIMEPQVRTCSPEDPLATAGRLMAEGGCGVVPVVDGEGHVVGMISDRDICLALAQRDEKPSAVPVREVMRTDVHTCTPENDIREALAQMSRWRVRRLPILDEQHHLAGIVSLDEVVLEAKPFVSEGFSGPLLNQVAETLRSVCRHDLPATRH